MTLGDRSAPLPRDARVAWLLFARQRPRGVSETTSMRRVV